MIAAGPRTKLANREVVDPTTPGQTKSKQPGDRYPSLPCQTIRVAADLPG